MEPSKTGWNTTTLGIIGAAISTLLSEIAVLVFAYIKSKGFVEVRVDRKEIISIFVGCLAIMLLCIGFKLYVGNWIIEFFAAAISSALAYTIILYYMNNQVMKDLVESSHSALHKLWR